MPSVSVLRAAYRVSRLSCTVASLHEINNLCICSEKVKQKLDIMDQEAQSGAHGYHGLRVNTSTTATNHTHSPSDSLSRCVSAYTPCTPCVAHVMLVDCVLYTSLIR
jgi:hypothetical protein